MSYNDGELMTSLTGMCIIFNIPYFIHVLQFFKFYFVPRSLKSDYVSVSQKLIPFFSVKECNLRFRVFQNMQNM